MTDKVVPLKAVPDTVTMISRELDAETQELIRQTAERYRRQFPEKSIELINERLKGFVDALLYLRDKKHPSPKADKHPTAS